MTKLLSGCAALLLGTIGCVRIIESEPVVHNHNEPDIQMTRRSKNITNIVIRLYKCSTFLSKPINIEYALQSACSYAGFDEDRVHVDHISSDLTTYTVYGYAGYAVIYASEKEQSFTLEFFGMDGFYSYPEFLGAFMEAFVSLNHGKCEVTYTNILE